MTKQELRRIALKLYNRGIINDPEVEYCPELSLAKMQDIRKCTDYVHELFRIGKTEFKKRYCIKYHQKTN